jgi:hypothetical protein
MPASKVARRAVTAVVFMAALSALAGCTGSLAWPGGAYASRTAQTSGATARPSSQPPTARTRAPSAPVSLLTDTSSPSDLTARFARTFFATSPVVVVASTASSTGTGTSAKTGASAKTSTSGKTTSANTATGKTASAKTSTSGKTTTANTATSGKTDSVASTAGKTLAAATRAATAAHAPLLLAPRQLTPKNIVELAASIKALHPMAVLVEGLPAQALAARLPGVRVVSQPTELPVTGPPAPLAGLAVLLPGSAAKPSAAPAATAPATAAEITVVTAMARVVGAAVIPVATVDPRQDPAAIRTLARLSPRHVVAVGTGFGPVSRLSARLAVAETGRQLPGGGQVLFPGHRVVALYGHPGTPGLGVLGQQDLPASIARARQIAAAYQPLSTVPVVPAFEIIATVAEAAPGPDDTYSAQTPVSELQPWIKQATAAGLYVVLDLQPGRASLLTQARVYQSLLELPDVGLAIDPEWKLLPKQKPLRQIGHVDIGEVNDVISWLAALTARHRLPQKLLVLHQFQLAMIVGEQHLDTSNDDLAIVIHMDGQGKPAAKEGTWNVVTSAAPPGVHFGWKDFLVMDHPMLTPQQTMAQSPLPVMISYQ